jgi:tetratricopeptide (TPR) repeat protein
MSEENFFKTNRELIVFTVLSALVLAVYWQTTNIAFINLDDNQYVFDNPAVKSGLNAESVKWAFTAFHSANWHPLTWLSHMLDIRLFGLNAGGHHATNIILHLINSCLTFVVFRKMTGCFWRSAALAALFAVHPAHVESVAWVAERKDVLSTMLWLLTMFAYVRYAESPVSSPKSQVENNADISGNADENNEKNKDENKLGTWDSGLGTKFYALTLILFALGLMAKPMLVTLPFVLLLMDFWSLERLKTLKDLPRLLIEKLPFFLLSAVSSYITILAQRSVGAVESLEYLPLGTRFLNALVSYAKYVLTLFYPAKLAVWYPYDRDFPAWQIGGAILLLAGVTALCVWQMRARKYLLMGWLWFLGTLVPVIGIVQVGAQPLADRYTYIPYFGLFVMLVWGLSDLFEKFRLNRNILYAALAAGVIIFAVLSFRQTALWRNNEILYKHTLAVTKDNFLISHNLCHSLTMENRLDEAEGFCRESIEANPDYYVVYNTLGFMNLKRGQTEEAERNFQEALRREPDYALGYANLSVAQSLLGKPEEAETNLEKSVRMSGDTVRPEVFIGALNDLAAAYAAKGNYEKASQNLSRILAIDSNNADARANLALTFYHLKRYDEAQKLIESALQLNPNEPRAYNTYGLILMEQNRLTEAAGLFEKALQLKPDYAYAR